MQIADTLGEMKGAVMKVGQIASQYKDIFPPEVAKAISSYSAKLRLCPLLLFSNKLNVSLESRLMLPLNLLIKNLCSCFGGQVHKAVLPSGEQVVVKVQYPGVDEACESDLKQVRLALRLMGVLKIDKSYKISFLQRFKIVCQQSLTMKSRLKTLKFSKHFIAN